MDNTKQNNVDKVMRGELAIENLTSDELQLLEETQQLKDALRLEDLIKNKDFIAGLEKEYQSQSKTPMVKPIGLIKSLAAVFVLLIGAVVVFNMGRTEFKSEDYVMHNSLRSDKGTQYSTEQIKAYNLFVLEQYELAIPLLNKLRNNPLDTISQYYLALSYYGMKDQKSYEVEIKDKRIDYLKKPK